MHGRKFGYVDYIMQSSERSSLRGANMSSVKYQIYNSKNDTCGIMFALNGNYHLFLFIAETYLILKEAGGSRVALAAAALRCAARGICTLSRPVFDKTCGLTVRAERAAVMAARESEEDNK